MSTLMPLSHLAQSDVDNFYKLSPDERKFFMAQTGIQDDAELKQHIVSVADEAFGVYPYETIRVFAFIRLVISKFPAYQDVKKLGTERSGALFLDLGCCFGNDIRMLVSEGFPPEQCIASDIKPEFWDLGHKLFRSTPESFPVHFIAGDVFDPANLSIHPFNPGNGESHSLPPVSKSSSLNDLKGQISAIREFALSVPSASISFNSSHPPLIWHHADVSSLFHLFTEPQQLHLARALAGLLLPKPGCVIFGMHPAKKVKGVYPGMPPNNHTIFSHSPESWTQMWEEQVFGSGSGNDGAVIKVHTKLFEIPRELVKYRVEHDDGGALYMMAWSVRVVSC